MAKSILYRCLPFHSRKKSKNSALCKMCIDRSDRVIIVMDCAIDPCLVKSSRLLIHVRRMPHQTGDVSFSIKTNHKSTP